MVSASLEVQGKVFSKPKNWSVHGGFSVSSAFHSLPLASALQRSWRGSWISDPPAFTYPEWRDYRHVPTQPVRVLLTIKLRAWRKPGRYSTNWTISLARDRVFPRHRSVSLMAELIFNAVSCSFVRFWGKCPPPHQHHHTWYPECTCSCWVGCHLLEALV